METINLEDEIICDYLVTQKMKKVWAVEIDMLKKIDDLRPYDDVYIYNGEDYSSSDYKWHLLVDKYTEERINPILGFYKYKTNPNMRGEWILAGEIKINKVLTDKEVEQILIDNNVTPMPRYNGELKIEEYGF